MCVQRQFTKNMPIYSSPFNINWFKLLKCFIYTCLKSKVVLLQVTTGCLARSLKTTDQYLFLRCVLVLCTNTWPLGWCYSSKVDKDKISFYSYHGQTIKNLWLDVVKYITILSCSLANTTSLAAQCCQLEQPPFQPWAHHVTHRQSLPAHAETIEIERHSILGISISMAETSGAWCLVLVLTPITRVHPLSLQSVPDYLIRKEFHIPLTSLVYLRYSIQ